MEKRNHKTNRKYDPQFRQEALKQVESGRKVSSVAQALGISEALLYGWRKKALGHPINGTTGSGELEALRKQVKQLETERDILKKALAIFSRPS
jgi:transposase